MERRSHIQLIFSTIGFVLVAVICAAAGFSSQVGTTEFDWRIVVKIVAFVFPLWPYYFFREVALEQKIQSGDGVKRQDSVQSSLIYFILSAGVSILVLYNIQQIPLPIPITLINCVIAWSAFAYLGWRTLNAAKNQEKLNREYRFDYRVLFPGLATCMIPFAFGWAIKDGNVLVLVISVLFVVMVSEITRLINLSLLRLLAIISTAILLSAILLSVYRPFGIIIFGALLSFGMGASEAYKRVHLVKSGLRPLAQGEDENFYLAGANWANSVFPVFLCLLPLLITEFPTLPILVYTGLHIFIWQIFIRDKSSRKAFIISTLLGYLLPVVIIVATTFLAGHHFLRNENLATLFALNSGLLAVSLGLASRFFSQKELKEIFLKKIWRNESYLNSHYSFWLFLIITYLVVLAVFGLATLFAALNEQTATIYRLKASEIQLGLFILLLARMLAAWILGKINHNGGGRNGDNDPDSNINSGLRKSVSVRPKKIGRATKALALLKIMRPDISAIAGLFVTCALFFSSNLSLGQAILLGLPITLVTMLGFIFNDLIDYEKDHLACADKPIARGIVLKDEVVYIACVLISVMVFLEWIVGTQESHLVLSMTLVGVAAYSYIANWASWAKGIVTAALCLSPFAYFYALTGQPIPLFALISLFIFIVGRELLIDTNSIMGDLNASVRTLAYYLGADRSRTIAWVSMFFAALLLSATVKGAAFIMTVLAGLVLCVSFFTSRHNVRQAILITRISMALGAIGVALSV